MLIVVHQQVRPITYEQNGHAFLHLEVLKELVFGPQQGLLGELTKNNMRF